MVQVSYKIVVKLLGSSRRSAVHWTQLSLLLAYEDRSVNIFLLTWPCSRERNHNQSTAISDWPGIVLGTGKLQKNPTQ